MPLTRSQAEALLLLRCHGKMKIVGMDAESTGDNPDLNGPLFDALTGMGITPADPLDITDADLSGVAAISELLDRAEYRLLRDIAGNIVLTDVTVGPRRESLSQLSGQIEKQIDRMQKHIVATYGVGTGTLTGGSISLDFQSEAEPFDFLEGE